MPEPLVTESILLSVRRMLGFDDTDTQYMDDTVAFINSELSTLVQAGVGPQTGFKITGASEVWTDFIGDSLKLESVKEYIQLRVKMVFDPPANSYVMTYYKEKTDELIWRLNVAADPGDEA